MRASTPLVTLLQLAAVGWLPAALSLPVVAAAQTEVAATHAFDLPAQPLADALPKVGEIIGADIIFDARVVSGKQAPALRGSFGANEALDRLLADSGLVHQAGEGRTIAILPVGGATDAADPQASANEAPLMLAPVVVTSTGAQRVLIVTQDDLDTRQATDLEDTLSIDPSVTVGGSTGIAQKIYVRNLGEGLLNIKVDGATQSGSLFHHIGRVTIEPELLKQVEIQPGVGNAADGPGALGGAIRFVTKDPSDLLHPGETAGALAKYGYFDNTNGHRGSLTGFGRANDTWSGLLSVVSSDHEEITDGDGNRLAGSDSQQQVVFGKVVGEFANGQRLRLSFENLEEEGDKLRRPEWAPGPANPAFYMEAERRTTTFGYGIRPEMSDVIDIDFTASYTDAHLLQIGPFGPYEGDIDGWQFDLRNTSRPGDHKLVYGVDHRIDHVEAGPRGGPVAGSEDATVTGLFAQGEFAAAERLTINAGARYDIYRLDDRLDQKFRHDGFSPNLGATYAFTPEFSVNAGVATAYRGPDINDAFKVDIANNDPDLDAEKAVNYELRFLYQKRGLQLEAGGYIHRIDDVITNTLPWSNVYTNAGELKTEGVFARASYDFGQVVVGVQYNHADTELNGQTATRYQYGSLVSQIGDTWVVDAVWRPRHDVDLGWNARIVQGVDDIAVPVAVTGVPGGSIDKPGYAVHDFFVRWRPWFAENLSLNLTVKNVFDKYYRSHASVEDMTAFPGFGGVVGAPEAGRDIRVSASWRF